MTEQYVAKFETESDKYADLQERANNLIGQEEAAVINTHEDNNKAADLTKLLLTNKKKLEEDRTSITGPLNDVIKNVNARYKPVTDAIDKAVKSIKAKMGDFARKEQERIREERRKQEQEIADKAMEKAEELAEAGKTDEAEKVLDTAAQKGNAIGNQAASVTGFGDFGGSSHTVSKLKYNVTDESAVPVEYKTVDMKKIDAAVSMAKAEYTAKGTTQGLKGKALTAYVNKSIADNLVIPGVHFYDDVDITVR